MRKMEKKIKREKKYFSPLKIQVDEFDPPPSEFR